MEKAKILWAMPNVSAEKTIDMRWLESKLEDAGHTKLAQIIRFHLYQQQPEGKMKRDCVIWCRNAPDRPKRNIPQGGSPGFAEGPGAVSAF